MRDINFHEVIISRKDHRLISADALAYGIVDNDMVNSLEEYVTIEYRESFVKNIERAEGNWFPARFGLDSSRNLYYIKASQMDDEDMIRLLVVNIDDLMETHRSMMHTINSFKAQLELYDDVFFEYDPKKDTVKVFNTESASFDSGIYDISEFEDFLLEKATGRQRNAVKGFISQIKSKVGRSSTRIDGNILNDDPGISHTVMDECFVFYDKENEGVVGHIHLATDKGKANTISIKHDSLTGLIDKTDIIRIAKERIDGRRLEGTTIAIIDIDFFKNINDTYGHQFGDEVIKKIADIISSEVGNDGIAGRFGGDEFLVVFYNMHDEDELRAKLKSIKNMVSATFPDKGIDRDNPLSVSIGSSIFPNDADNYDDVFMLADYCLYLAKDKGRNRYIIYTLAKHGTLESIRNSRAELRKINERDNSYGDVIVKMFDMTIHGDDSSIEHYMDEFAEAFELQHLTLFVGKPFVRRYSTGIESIKSQTGTEFLLGILNSDAKNKYLSDCGFVVVNRLDSLPPYAGSVKEFLKELGVFSYILIRFLDKDKRECVLIIASVGKKTQWNQTHFKYYRAFTDLLALHSLGENN